MPGGNYEAGNVSYGIPYSEWRDCAREFMKIKCPETTALSAPCPASYPIPSPHLLLRTLHPTSPYLCPASVPVHRHEYEYEYEQYPAHLHGS